MDQIIAQITTAVVNDIKFNEEAVNQQTMLLYLNQYYRNARRNMAHSKDPSRFMTELVAIKQMIDALSYNP